jgi:hypothetical protein
VKNVTVSVDDGLYERARAIAAQRKTTLSGLLRECLDRLTGCEGQRNKARREILRMIGSFDCKLGCMPSREERNARR